MAGSDTRQMRARSAAANKQTGKGGSKKSKGSTSMFDSAKVGPVVLGFLVFVVVGSFLLQIVRNASGGKAIGF